MHSSRMCTVRFSGRLWFWWGGGFLWYGDMLWCTASLCCTTPASGVHPETLVYTPCFWHTPFTSVVDPSPTSGVHPLHTHPTFFTTPRERTGDQEARQVVTSQPPVDRMADRQVSKHYLAPNVVCGGNEKMKRSNKCTLYSWFGVKC